jgi:membrane-associated phospholipid phosphatase
MRLGLICSFNRPLCFVFILIFVFFFITPQSVACKEASEIDYRLNKEFFIGFGDDIYDVVRAPVSWESKDWRRFGAVLGTAGVLYVFDQRIHDWSQDRRTPSSEDWARFGSFLGNGAFLGGLITSLYLSGEIFNEKGLRKTALLSLESWFTAGAFVLCLKAIAGRARPDTGYGPHHFEPFSFRTEYISFPSGHAASAFAVATVIADQTDHVLVDVMAYSLSVLAAAARVHMSKHWASDAFIGAAIGYFVGKKICSLHRNRDKKNVQIGFTLSPSAKGVTVEICF